MAAAALSGSMPGGGVRRSRRPRRQVSAPHRYRDADTTASERAQLLAAIRNSKVVTVQQAVGCAGAASFFLLLSHGMTAGSDTRSESGYCPHAHLLPDVERIRGPYGVHSEVGLHSRNAIVSVDTPTPSFVPSRRVEQHRTAGFEVWCGEGGPSNGVVSSSSDHSQ